MKAEEILEKIKYQNFSHPRFIYFVTLQNRKTSRINVTIGDIFYGNVYVDLPFTGFAILELQSNSEAEYIRMASIKEIQKYMENLPIVKGEYYTSIHMAKINGKVFNSCFSKDFKDKRSYPIGVAKEICSFTGRKIDSNLIIIEKMEDK